MVKIAVLGHGVVGSGVVEVLHTNSAGITQRAKEEIEVKYILDLRDFPELPYADKFVKDFSVIENDPEVRIVVECLGGVKFSYDYVKRSLLAGKSVVTSNKELIATCGQELLEIASERNLNLLFEASVGGGIPIIRPLSQCMAANEIQEIAGILNGTTNFILTKMIDESMSFDDALALAQKLGYAERDPSADVDGHDACRKICILASLVFGKHVHPDCVHTEGIRKITLSDVAYAGKFNSVIKLIGSVRTVGDEMLEISVEPMIIPKDNQLAGVNDVFNAVMVRGNATGDVVFYGKGAGKLPTASAVVADVIDCVKHFKARKYIYWADGGDETVQPYDTVSTALFVIAKGSGIEKQANELWGQVRTASLEDRENELAFITPVLTIAQHKALLDKLDGEIIQTMRIFS